jgi:hypothetical protein
MKLRHDNDNDMGYQLSELFARREIAARFGVKIDAGEAARLTEATRRYTENLKKFTAGLNFERNV